MTCHNRRDSTAGCLAVLKAQANHELAIEPFVTDDGSTDGTADAIRRVWQDATIIQGTGTLFWAAGMALAERTAVRTQPDFLLWLNDDVILDPDAVVRLTTTSSQYPGAIIVGATIDPMTGDRTYGGRLRPGWHPQRLTPLPLSDRPQRADTFNGNVVLVPWQVRQRVGPIDGGFPHAYADDDYGLRATAMGVPIIQAPGALGRCRRDSPRDVAAIRVTDRWASLQAPGGLPWRAQARYLKRHGDWRWPLILLAGQARRVAGRR
jgi:GT2 family glycosyltransferase